MTTINRETLLQTFAASAGQKADVSKIERMLAARGWGTKTSFTAAEVATFELDVLSAVGQELAATGGAQAAAIANLVAQARACLAPELKSITN